MTPRMGLVPMGGTAARWRPLPVPKELLPCDAQPGGNPVLVMDYAFQAMMQAGVDRLIVPIHPRKSEAIMRYTNERFPEADVVFVATETSTMLESIMLGLRYAGDCDVLFAMPDTAFEPLDVVDRCVSSLDAGHELALACFHGDDVRDLDTVDLAMGGEVDRVHPKPHDRTGAAYFWGLAAWRPSFTARLLSRADRTDTLGSAFDAAARRGSALHVVVDGSHYADLGTPSAYFDFIAQKRLARLAKCAGHEQVPAARAG
jgi:dTDP-glucose pyrophosphorylase